MDQPFVLSREEQTFLAGASCPPDLLQSVRAVQAADEFARRLAPHTFSRDPDAPPVPLGPGILPGHKCDPDCFVSMPLVPGYIRGAARIHICVHTYLPHLCGETLCGKGVPDQKGIMTTCAYTSTTWRSEHEQQIEYDTRSNAVIRDYVNRTEELARRLIAADDTARADDLARTRRQEREFLLGSKQRDQHDDVRLALLKSVLSGEPDEPSSASPAVAAVAVAAAAPQARPPLVHGAVGVAATASNTTTAGVGVGKKRHREETGAAAAAMASVAKVLRASKAAEREAQKAAAAAKRERDAQKRREAAEAMRKKKEERTRLRAEQKERDAKSRKVLPLRGEVTKRPQKISEKQKKRRTTAHFEVQSWRLARDMTQVYVDPMHGRAEVDLIIKRVFCDPFPEERRVKLTKAQREHLYACCRELWVKVIDTLEYSCEPSRFDMISTFLFVIFYGLGDSGDGIESALFTCKPVAWCRASPADIATAPKLMGLRVSFTDRVIDLRKLLASSNAYLPERAPKRPVDTDEEKQKRAFLSTVLPTGDTVAQAAARFAARTPETMPVVYPILSCARVFPPT